MANSSLQAQRSRLLAALKIAGSTGLTTIQAREEHDIMMPAARVFELRYRQGWNIETVWTLARNAQGNKHRVARYVLLPGTYGETEKAA
jgi:hypothetical protein